MTELDRIYEEIERLLEVELKPQTSAQTVDKNNSDSKMVQVAQEMNAKNPNAPKWQYAGESSTGKGLKYVFSRQKPNKQNPNKMDTEWGYYFNNGDKEQITQYQPGTKPVITKPYTPSNSNGNGQGQPAAGQPAPAQAAEPAAEEVAAEPVAEGEATAGGSLVPAGNRSVEPSQNSQGNKEPYVAQDGDVEVIGEESSNGGVPATPEQLQKLEQETSPIVNSLIKNVPANTWEDGTWTTLCKKSNGYFYPKNNMIGNVQISVATRIRPQQDVTPIKPDEVQMRPDAYNKNSGQTYSIGKWYATAEYKDGKWNLVDPPRPAKLNQVSPSTKNLVSTGFEGSEAPDFWTSGQWKNQCNENQDGYFYLKNNPNARVKALDPDKILPKEGHLKLTENDWYLVEEFQDGKWMPVKKTLLRDVPGQIPPEAEAVLNTNTQLNYRLKSVIDSPDIQKQIDASPNGINYVGLNGDKISLITMGESLNSPIEIPSFLLKKLTEAKEVEISSLGAGGQTNLNVFLTPEIQEYLKSQKGNPNITKVMLGKDGLVWLMDDKNNPYLLNDMKVNDNVPAKDQKDNSVNVFINNGGAGNNGNGGNGQNANTNGDGNGNGSDGPSGEATGIVSRAEILAIKNTMAERVKNAVDSIKLDEVNNALKEYNTQINFTQLQLSKPLDGTYINDNSNWQSFKIVEANENGAQEQKVEKKEETTPQQTTNGDPENYIIGAFTLTPIEGENETQQDEGQEETPAAETPENNGEEPAQDTQSNKRNNWEDVLREAQELLKRVREEENPEAEEGAEEAAESDKEKEKAAAEAKKKEEEKNQVLQKCFMLSLVKASEAVAEALGTIKLQRKTNDQTTFTGRKTEETVFSFTPGQQKNFGWKKLDDNTFKCWFSVMIIKNGTTDTTGTKFNRVMNKVAGVANAVNKLNAGVSYDKV